MAPSFLAPAESATEHFQARELQLYGLMIEGISAAKRTNVVPSRTERAKIRASILT